MICSLEMCCWKEFSSVNKVSQTAGVETSALSLSYCKYKATTWVFLHRNSARGRCFHEHINYCAKHSDVDDPNSWPQSPLSLTHTHTPCEIKSSLYSWTWRYGCILSSHLKAVNIKGFPYFVSRSLSLFYPTGSEVEINCNYTHPVLLSFLII